jgi:hypothetical protein
MDLMDANCGFAMGFSHPLCLQTFFKEQKGLLQNSKLCLTTSSIFLLMMGLMVCSCGFGGSSPPTRVTEINTEIENSGFIEMPITDSKLYFVSLVAEINGIELSEYDESSPRTRVGAYNHFGGMSVHDKRLYFSADDGSHGTEL